MLSSIPSPEVDFVRYVSVPKHTQFHAAIPERTKDNPEVGAPTPCALRRKRRSTPSPVVPFHFDTPVVGVLNDMPQLIQDRLKRPDEGIIIGKCLTKRLEVGRHVPGVSRDGQPTEDKEKLFDGPN